MIVYPNLPLPTANLPLAFRPKGPTGPFHHECAEILASLPYGGTRLPPIRELVGDIPRWKADEVGCDNNARLWERRQSCASDVSSASSTSSSYLSDYALSNTSSTATSPMSSPIVKTIPSISVFEHQPAAKRLRVHPAREPFTPTTNTRRSRSPCHPAYTTTTPTTPAANNAISKIHKRRHNNEPYSRSDLDFVMHHRQTKLPWKPLTALYEHYEPSLREYRPNRKADPKRTVSGLQAGYYRWRAELPALTESGDLVFDEVTGRQVFHAVKVRDEDKKEDKIDLIQMFPERVVYYNYFFVSPEDMARARALAAKYERQRMEHKQPLWQPEADTQHCQRQRQLRL